MKVKFIVNPTSGKCAGLKISQDLAGFGDVSCTSAADRNCAFELAKKAVLEGFERIVAVGGDGTINETINGMAAVEGLNVPLGIIPIGTGNDFARNLGIFPDPKKALDVALGNCVSRVDLGMVNRKYFANVVSFGFDAKVTALARDLRRTYGFLPKELIYLLATLKENIVSGLGKYPVTMRADGFPLAGGEVAFLVIANGRTYGRIFKIAPRADTGDGLLNLCRIKPMGRLRALANIYKVIRGTHETLPEVMTKVAESFDVFSAIPLVCEMDGEVLAPQLEYKISVAPKALKVLASGPDLQSA